MSKGIYSPAEWQSGLYSATSDLFQAARWRKELSQIYSSSGSLGYVQRAQKAQLEPRLQVPMVRVLQMVCISS